jgi:hypothetical protein
MEGLKYFGPSQLCNYHTPMVNMIPENDELWQNIVYIDGITENWSIVSGHCLDFLLTKPSTVLLAWP